MTHREPVRPVAHGGLVCLVAFAVLAAGCAGPWRAARLAARMRNPGVPPRKRLRLRQELLALGADSQAFLAEAFFPLGLYDVPESALHQVAAAGFNLVVNADTEPEYLTRAESAGLRLIPYIRLQRMEEDVRLAGPARPIFAWYLVDEPDLNGVPPGEYRALANRLRKLDPERPIFLTVWSPDRYAEYAEACDILAPNPYAIRHEEPAENDLRQVAAALDAARSAAEGKPVWAVIQAFRAPPHWPRLPTPQEVRAMVFLALNHGADGIIYFSYRSGDRPITERRALFQEITRLNGHLRALRGALLVRPLLGGGWVWRWWPRGGPPRPRARRPHPWTCPCGRTEGTICSSR